MTDIENLRRYLSDPENVISPGLSDVLIINNIKTNESEMIENFRRYLNDLEN